MKSILLFSIINILVMGCGINKKDKIEEPVAITYLAQSRGYFYKVIVSNSEINVEKDAMEQNGVTKKIDSKTWSEYCTIINSINLSKMNNFKSSSDASMVDRAAIATLKIDFSSDSYESNTFDHGTPPKELKQLIDKILALAETTE